jgi:2-dehydro-3-deoxyphosphogluconate aldolase/(4S)-4-hydroxy-2-oxoglutarate aldolase
MVNCWLDILKKNRAIAVIRSPDFILGLKMAEAVAKGGIEVIEVTWNSHQPATLLQKLRLELPHCTLGTGTIITLRDWQKARDSGIEFCFTPHVQPLLLEAAGKEGIPMIPGALTPTEIVHAWELGASCVKVFPISAVGGASYIKSLQGPLSQIPLIPTGGVNPENAIELIRAGAIAVGLSTQLFPEALVEAQAWEEITARVRLLQESLRSIESRPN